MLAQLANQQTSQEDRLSYIKALGNAGSSQARQKLQEILMDKKQLLHHRVECVWALRRIAQHTREKVSDKFPSVGEVSNKWAFSTYM